jgi:8-oxo-dGTP diphosphatase
LFTATGFEGEIAYDACDEGELMWVDKKNIENLNLWEGDKVFLRLLEDKDHFFSVKLSYVGDRLVDSVVWE